MWRSWSIRSSIVVVVMCSVVSAVRAAEHGGTTMNKEHGGTAVSEPAASRQTPASSSNAPPTQTPRTTPKALPSLVKGSVEGLDINLRVRTEDGKVVPLELGDRKAISVLRNDKESELGQVEVGDHVEVTYTTGRDGTRQVSSVVAQASKPQTHAVVPPSSVAPIAPSTAPKPMGTAAPTPTASSTAPTGSKPMTPSTSAGSTAPSSSTQQKPRY